MKLRSIPVVCWIVLSVAAFAQRLDPAKWTMTVEPAAAPPGAHVLARITAKLEPGWHLYSLSTPRGGPIPTTLGLMQNPAVQGFKIYQPKPVRKFDPNFNLETETYEGEPAFLLDVHLKPDAPLNPAELTAQVRYQLCTDKLCLPPVRRTASATLTVDPGASSPNIAIPTDYLEFTRATTSAVPVRQNAPQAQGFTGFLLVAFGFGLAAIFTPCVFPMIPITMSYFLNKPSVSRRQSVVEAVVFCLGIVVLFTMLGLIVTAALGPFGVVQLGSNLWVNSFIALVFLAFGLSLLGAFEITIPSSVLTRLDRASQQGGLIGTLVMGLTFSLAAFACVGPFVGTLLAASVQGGGFRPATGMLAFAGGLALPFFFLALFPSYLKRMPKSGGWLARVKVVMGFVILAAMFKYVSAVDQVLQWNVLTRERFLAAWIVLFAMAGLYLLGFLRLEGVQPDQPVGLPRLLIGAVLLIFAFSLLPGMFGGRLGELDAYVPQVSGIRLGAGAGSGEDGLAWMKNDYRAALAKAKAEGKLVLVSFTGYACTNCHWMKANMFTRPEIAAALQEHVLVELYTDGTDAASEENQRLQESRFQTVAIPYYALMDREERVVATFAGLTRDPQQFLAFLRAGKRTL